MTKQGARENGYLSPLSHGVEGDEGYNRSSPYPEIKSPSAREALAVAEDGVKGLLG